jgi:hypothetical protein
MGNQHYVSHFCAFMGMSLYVPVLIDSNDRNSAQNILHRCIANSRERLQHLLRLATKSMKLKICDLPILRDDHRYRDPTDRLSNPWQHRKVFHTRSEMMLTPR